jgi:murein DD-endopeptidase MepM/ murein hydrolase activator NlpD
MPILKNPQHLNCCSVILPKPLQQGLRESGRVSQSHVLLVAFFCAGIVFLTGIPGNISLSSRMNFREASNEAYVYPIVAARMSSGFGDRKHPIYRVARHHKGIDLAAPKDTPIRAIRAGTVVFADPYAGYGNLIVILHDDGLTSHYGHCNSFETQIGAKVEAGHIIARVGSTGKVTGPHLHFEIRRNGVAENPEKFLPGLTAKALG